MNFFFFFCNCRYEANAFTTAEHCGTHLDAPCHFAKGAWSVDQIPPDRFYGPGEKFILFRLRYKLFAIIGIKLFYLN